MAAGQDLRLPDRASLPVRAGGPYRAPPTSDQMEKRVVDTGGQIAKFNKRFAGIPLKK